MKNTARPMIANLYNPHEQNKAQLIERFIVRQREFQTIVQGLAASTAATPSPPYLLEGQRGMGKTTLLLRVSYEVENDPELSTWLLPIVLKEEAFYGVRQLFRLWEVLAQELEAKDRSFAGLFARMQEARRSFPTSSASAERYESACFTLLTEALRERGRCLLVCIDNLGDMLHNFSDHENARFRRILTSCPRFRLIGATSVVLTFIQEGRLARLFRGVFTTLQLEGLKKAETHELFLALAKASDKKSQFYTILAQYPGRFEALRILTGGVIRTLVLLFEVFLENRRNDSFTDLEDILDRVTPLYQSRMNDLTPHQRDVVNAIALQWDAMTLEEIEAATYIPRPEVETLVRQLETMLIVQHVVPGDQQHLYQLRERFFNIWYLMRLAPGESRSRVLWLLHFLESWYDQGELVRQARRHTEAMAGRQALSHSAYYLTEALVRTGKLDMTTEHRLLQAARTLLQETDPELTDDLSLSDSEYVSKANACMAAGDYRGAVAELSRIKRKTGPVFCRLGEAFAKQAQYEQARRAFLKAIEQGNVEAMLHLGDLYGTTLKESRAAEKFYRMAVQQGSLEAMVALGSLFAQSMGDAAQAERYYLMALNEGRQRTKALAGAKFSFKALLRYIRPNANNDAPSSDAASGAENAAGRQYAEHLLRLLGDVLLRLGTLYAEDLHDATKAAHYYERAIKNGSREAVMHLALLCHFTLHDYRKAIKYYASAVKHDHNMDAAVNLGMLYQQMFKDYVNAEKYYLIAVENGHVGAMNGLAWLYFEEKECKAEALRYAEQAAEHAPTVYTAHTLACIYLWNNRPADAVRTARQFMYDPDAYANLSQDILLYLLLLLAKQEYAVVADYFADPGLNLRERFKPVYYAFLYHTQNPDYYKRPPELVEPIGGLIGRIQRLTAGYQ